MVPGLSITRKFKSYVGLGKAYSKLKFLLNEHEFINVEMAVQSIDWDKTENVFLS